MPDVARSMSILRATLSVTGERISSALEGLFIALIASSMFLITVSGQQYCMGMAVLQKSSPETDTAALILSAQSSVYLPVLYLLSI